MCHRGGVDGVGVEGSLIDPAAGITEVVLRRMLRVGVPAFADLPLVRVRVGWDNELWRLGEGLAVRVTRRAVSAGLHANEQRWLPVLAPRLSLPVPVPVWAGSGGSDLPWPWSVVPWFEGDVAAEVPPARSESAALGRFLSSLHTPAPDDAPHSSSRGVPLEQLRPAVAEWERCSRGRVDPGLVEAAMAVFEAGTTVEQADERVWIHGDLHPRNVLVRAGRLAAVLDWGDVTAGDPATDLAALWWLFDLPAHRGFWSSYRPVSAATWHRARAWAAVFGLSFLSFGLPDDPVAPDLTAHELARHQLARVVAAQQPPFPNTR